jgi:hypothetical protein
MKKSIVSITSGSLPLLLTLLTLLFCNGGGGTISGTGPHKMGGVLYEQYNNKPASNATVYLRPIDYLPVSGNLAKRKAASSSAVQSTVTDKNGWFEFDNLSVETYTIEGISSDEKSVVFINRLSINANFLESETWYDVNSQGYATVLQPPATIIGTVPVPKNCDGGNVSVFGTEYHTDLHSDGTFILDRVPESILHLKIEYSASSYTYTDTISAPTVSAQTTEIDTSNTVFNFRRTGPVTFRKSYGGFDFNRGVSIKLTGSEAYIIAGKDGSALHLMKIDNYGQILSDNTFDSYCEDDCQFIEQIQNGGFIIAGRSPDEDTEYNNLALTLIDTNGTIIWSKSSDNYYIDKVNVLQQTSDGGFIIAGNREKPESSKGFCLFKVNNQGDVVWERTYISMLVGFSGEIVQQTEDDGYIITALNVADQQFVILKTDANGSIVQDKSYGSFTVNASHSIARTSDFGYIITGSSRIDNNSVSNIHCIKTDSDGNQIWEKRLTDVNNQVGHEIKQTVDGGYIIIGISTSAGGNQDMLLVKIDGMGSKIWSKTIGESNLIEDGHSVWLTSDGGYLFAGTVKSSTESDSLLLIKTDAAGDVESGD